MAVAGHAEGRRRVERGRKGTRRVDAHVTAVERLSILLGVGDPVRDGGACR